MANGSAVAATLKLRYHQYTFGVAVWLAVMMPDPQSVFKIIPSSIWPIVIRNVELLLLAYYVTSQHSSLSLLYAPRPVPSSITHAMKVLCYIFAVMAIILPILQLAIGWQLFLVILIFIFDIISFVMPILSWISLIRVRRLLTGLVTYGTSNPATIAPSPNNGVLTSPGGNNGNGANNGNNTLGVPDRLPLVINNNKSNGSLRSDSEVSNTPPPVTVIVTTPQGAHTTTLVSSTAVIASAVQVRADVFRSALKRLTIGVVGTSILFFAGIIYDAMLLRQRLPRLFEPVESVSPTKYALPIAHVLLLLAESLLIWYSWSPLSCSRRHGIQSKHSFGAGNNGANGNGGTGGGQGIVSANGSGRQYIVSKGSRGNGGRVKTHTNKPTSPLPTIPPTAKSPTSMGTVAPLATTVAAAAAGPWMVSTPSFPALTPVPLPSLPQTMTHQLTNTDSHCGGPTSPVNNDMVLIPMTIPGHDDHLPITTSADDNTTISPH
jgi:hypothetical protein